MDSLRSSRWKVALSLSSVFLVTTLSGACHKSGEGEAGTASADLRGPIQTVAASYDGRFDRVAQMAYFDGDVVARPAGVDEWGRVETNAPLFEGYELYADPGAHGELLLGDNRYCRFGDGADVTLTRLDNNWAQMSLGSGVMTLALDAFSPDEHWEINAPGCALLPRSEGAYRVDVLDNGDTQVTVLRGTALITTPNGTVEAHEGDVVNLGYENPANVRVLANAAPGYYDDWDRWSYDRDAYYSDFYRRDIPDPVRSLYGRDDIFGIAQLVGYGVWRSLDNDRYVWQPTVSVGPDWAPYQDGAWDYSSVAGWNWVSQEPWGWAPYHYGRWDYVDQYGWCWAPYQGQEVTGYSSWSQPYRWSPAEVYVWQPPRQQVYAWVPLAPGEPYVPFDPAFIATAPAAFEPRFVREQRILYVTSPEDLERRVKPRRFAGEQILGYVPQQNAQLAYAPLPKPARMIAANEVAPEALRPPQQIRQRQVVVDPDSLDKIAKVAPNSPLARDAKAFRKATRDKQLQVDRTQVAAQTEAVPPRGRVRLDPRAGGTQGQAERPGAVAQNDREARKLAKQQMRDQRQQGAIQAQLPDARKVRTMRQVPQQRIAREQMRQLQTEQANQIRQARQQQAQRGRMQQQQQAQQARQARQQQAEQMRQARQQQVQQVRQQQAQRAQQVRQQQAQRVQQVRQQQAQRVQQVRRQQAQQVQQMRQQQMQQRAVRQQAQQAQRQQQMQQVRQARQQQVQQVRQQQMQQRQVQQPRVQQQVNRGGGGGGGKGNGHGKRP